MSFLDSVERAHYSDIRYGLIQIPGYAPKRVVLAGKLAQLVLTPVKSLSDAQMRAN